MSESVFTCVLSNEACKFSLIFNVNAAFCLLSPLQSCVSDYEDKLQRVVHLACAVIFERLFMH